MIQIKIFLYFPPSVKSSEKILRDGVNDFFNEINKWLEDKNVDPTNVIVSDSSDYIFIHVLYKVKKKPTISKK